MVLKKIMSDDKKYYMNTFGERIPVCFQKGSGVKLYDTDGRMYYDFFAGIAVSVLGHSHPVLVNAIKNQAEQVLHTSSLYYVEGQAALAKKIVENSCADKVFLANSGAEANEGAIKLARIYHYKKGSGRYKIITLKNSFHGRTMTTVAATGQEKYQKPYAPLTPGFSHIEINDIDAFKNAVDEKTAAVIFEPIQGEGGVYPVDNEYIKEVYEICRENDILVICDEVQTGMGRTGKMWGYEHTPIKPDIFTLAKALGGGVPIGALCARENVAAFELGDHGSTFGGNPLACSAALAVFDVLEKEKLVENADAMGTYFKSRLLETPGISEVRGRGLMLGIAMENAPSVQKHLFEKGFLVGCAGGDTLRILPPLIVTKEDINLFVTALADTLSEGIDIK